MLLDKLDGHKIILASQSPRRKELLNLMNIPFAVRLKPVEEIFPDDLNGKEIAEHIARLKANAHLEDIAVDEIIITADTVVWCDGRAMGKPADVAGAKEMIKHLSGKTHEVITAICLLTSTGIITDSDVVTVHFKDLTDEEIDFYIEDYKPFDKAGAYGIQEWIGHVGITKIEGAYNTVVGLPTHLLYAMLNRLLN
ncbi:MAG: septum formation protein Maf [Cytophagaceae bacterium]|nr:septum formation protein Maf [Cytophagaceae bacterium]|tara:strand:- start:6966 stop:7553 length:588 start_codon:yes stop_codon:yes gene_type:complete